MSTDPTAKPRKDGKAFNACDFEQYLLENVVFKFF